MGRGQGLERGGEFLFLTNTITCSAMCSSLSLYEDTASFTNTRTVVGDLEARGENREGWGCGGGGGWVGPDILYS